MRNLAAMIGLAGAAAAGSLLTGCGGTMDTSSNTEASKSPSQLLSDAKHAVRAARSVLIAGHGVAQGQAPRLDLSLAPGPEATGLRPRAGRSN